MWTSLEARAPFLDNDVIALSRQMPLDHKVQETTGKVVLRQMLERYVPASMWGRPKAGFGVPIDVWLRTDLRTWTDELLAPVIRGEDEHVDAEVVHRLWKEHLDGRVNRQ
jgi:asparagine synthase (glutamine-hydrolysing)